MIQSLEIENYQSHVDSCLEFSPGVNLIIGESDHGKSAIFRAIYWCAMNRPLGDAFINWNNEKNMCSVTLTNDKHTIVRAIGKNINSYFLDDLNNELTGFNKGVPESIIEALKLDKLNFHRQKDSFYLLNQSAPEIGRYLNNIIDLDVIDKSLSHANGRVRNFNTNIEYKEKEIESLEKNLEAYVWVDKANRKLEQLEDVEDDIYRRQNKKQKIQVLLHNINKEQQTITKLKPVLTYKNKLTKLEKLNGIIIKDIERADKIENVLTDIKTQRQIIVKYKDNAGRIKNIKNLEELMEVIRGLKKRKKEIETLLTHILTFDYEIKEEQEKLDKAHKEFDKLMPDNCPLCGQEV